MRDPQGRELITTKTPMRLAFEAAILAKVQQGDGGTSSLQELVAGTSPKAGLKTKPAWTVSRRVKRTAGRGR